MTDLQNSRRDYASEAVTAVETASETLMTPDSAYNESREIPVGRTGRFVRKGLLGAGGMGAVYEADDLLFDRQVALKTLLPHAANRRTARERFAFEAKVSARLEHPGIPPVYDTGEDDSGLPFLAMRLVQGETLAQILSQIRAGDQGWIAQFPLPKLLAIFDRVCDTVAYAHSRGVIHRDLKPANIMVATFGEVFVMDWGLAKAITNDVAGELAQTQIDLDSETGAETLTNPAGDMELTAEGAILGSFGYMAPEQASGRSSAADERSDIYSLGAILYSILTLAAPVRGRDSNIVLDRIRSGDIRAPMDFSSQSWLRKRHPLPHLRKIPSDLSHICMKALNSEPRDRYVSVAVLQADLFAAQNDKVTIAESPTLLVRSRKWLARNKGSLVWMLVFAGIALAFSFQKYQTVRRMRHVAPYHARTAEFLVSDKRLADALAEINTALDFEPSNAAWLFQKACILQSLGKTADSIRLFEQVFKQDPKNLAAGENIRISRKLLAAAAPPSPEKMLSQKEFYEMLLDQGRFAEANLAATSLLSEREYLLGFWNRRIDSAGLKRKTKLDRHGNIELSVSGEVRSIDALRGMPLSSFGCRNQPLTSIDALRGAPLKELTIIDTRVADLSPVRSAPLSHLAAHFSPIRSLEVLVDSPLESISISHSVSDLRPLAQMRNLKRLEIFSETLAGYKAIDIQPLAETKLDFLLLQRVALTNLTPLAGLPLNKLVLDSLPLTDLTPLRASYSLKHLELVNLPVLDLSPLADLSLKHLRLDDCPRLTNIASLTNLISLESLTLPPNAANIGALRSLRNLKQIGFPGEGVSAAEFWKAFDEGKLPKLQFKK